MIERRDHETRRLDDSCRRIEQCHGIEAAGYGDHDALATVKCRFYRSPNRRRRSNTHAVKDSDRPRANTVAVAGTGSCFPAPLYLPRSI
jgi:hypothetical protein